MDQLGQSCDDISQINTDGIVEGFRKELLVTQANTYIPYCLFGCLHFPAPKLAQASAQAERRLQVGQAEDAWLKAPLDNWTAPPTECTYACSHVYVAYSTPN